MAPYARWLWLWPCCKLFDAIVVELIEEPKSQQLKCCYHGENQEHVRRVHLGILSWVVRERSWTSDSEKVVVWGDAWRSVGYILVNSRRNIIWLLI